MKKRLPLHVSRLEDRIAPAAYSYDGSGNNLQNPMWGAFGTAQLRVAPAAYADGISAVGGASRPSPRVISNALAGQTAAAASNARLLSAMTYAWGQFIDHDLDLTPTGATEVMRVAVPKGDPWFDPMGTGTQAIFALRSEAAAGTGTSAANPRQQVNSITSWLDGSMVYGSNAKVAHALRSLTGGRLHTSAGGLLPFNTGATTVPMANIGIVPDSAVFAAGDVRANENIELIALQTLFVREHNHWADRFAAANPTWSDEQLYQAAREVVIAEIQAITYNEWLPAILGPGAIAPYGGYRPNVNPQVANEFATAGFRFGHSLLADDIGFLDNQGLPVTDEVPLAAAFFNPTLIVEHGIDPVLKYLVSDLANELDTRVVDGVRNFLFGAPGAGGLDLASLNIQRGRDHGLADYNATRVAYGLPAVTSFAGITSDPELRAKLEKLYGSVDTIDLWVGALAEDHLPGASVGPTLRAVISEQFTRTRDGDRFWYQRSYSGPLLQEIDRTRLADVIERNSGLTTVQNSAFFFRARIDGTVFADHNNNGRINPGEPGFGGVSVRLINLADQSVVAQTRTDPAGRYVFDVAGGLRTGRFAVQITPPAGLRPGLPPRPVAISGGDDFERYDIGLVPMFRVFVGGTSSDDQPLTSDPVAPKGGLPPKPMTPFAAGMI